MSLLDQIKTMATAADLENQNELNCSKKTNKRKIEHKERDIEEEEENFEKSQKT